MESPQKQNSWKTQALNSGDTKQGFHFYFHVLVYPHIEVMCISRSYVLGPCYLCLLDIKYSKCRSMFKDLPP